MQISSAFRPFLTISLELKTQQEVLPVHLFYSFAFKDSWLNVGAPPNSGTEQHSATEHFFREGNLSYRGDKKAQGRSLPRFFIVTARVHTHS